MGAALVFSRPACLQDGTDESSDDEDWVEENVLMVERSDSGSDSSDAGAEIVPDPAAAPKAGPKAAAKAVAAPAAAAVPEAAPKAAPKPKVTSREQTEDRHRN